MVSSDYSGTYHGIIVWDILWYEIMDISWDFCDYSGKSCGKDNAINAINAINHPQVPGLWLGSCFVYNPQSWLLNGIFYGIRFSTSYNVCWCMLICILNMFKSYVPRLAHHGPTIDHCPKPGCFDNMICGHFNISNAIYHWLWLREIEPQLGKQPAQSCLSTAFQLLEPYVDIWRFPRIRVPKSSKLRPY